MIFAELDVSVEYDLTIEVIGGGSEKHLLNLIQKGDVYLSDPDAGDMCWKILRDRNSGIKLATVDREPTASDTKIGPIINAQLG